jgi:hypothetical protein
MPKSKRLLLVSQKLLAITAIATILASLGVIAYCLLEPAKAEERLSGRRPTYLRSALNADPLADYGLVFGIGHNSGASLQTINQALTNGADVIEIDIVPMGNTLIAAHDTPLPIVGRAVFRGPTLAQAWRAAAGAEVIQLDVKISTPESRKLLVAFLESHPTDQAVMVATSDTTLLAQLRDQQPQVFRFLGVSDAATLTRLLADPDVAALIDGVTIRHQFVTEDTMAALKERNLIVLAWTVNDLASVNRLVALGVDGVSTDSLPIMRLLGGNQNGERRFAAYRSSIITAQHDPGDPEVDAPVEAQHLHPDNPAQAAGF